MSTTGLIVFRRQHPSRLAPLRRCKRQYGDRCEARRILISHNHQIAASCLSLLVQCAGALMPFRDLITLHQAAVLHLLLLVFSKIQEARLVAYLRHCVARQSNIDLGLVLQT